MLHNVLKELDSIVVTSNNPSNASLNEVFY